MPSECQYWPMTKNWVRSLTKKENLDPLVYNFKGKRKSTPKILPLSSRIYTVFAFLFDHKKFRPPNIEKDINSTGVREKT